MIEVQIKGKLQIISREEWNGRQPKPAEDKQDLPAIRVIIAHTDSDPCTTQVFIFLHFPQFD